MASAVQHQQPPILPPNDKANPWWSDEPPTISPETRMLFEQYSKISPGEIEAHAYAIREQGWKVHPYPCLGGWRFLQPSLCKNPAYPDVLKLLKSYTPPSAAEPQSQPSNSDTTDTDTDTNTGIIASPPGRGPQPRFLDLGCCVGQDIRQLVADGVHPSLILGADLHAAFIELGYAMFRDSPRSLPVRFLVGDVLAAGSAPGEAGGSPGPFDALRGTVQILHASAFLHLWGWDGQIEVASRMVALMRDAPGVLIVGRQVGNVKPGVKEHRTNSDKKMFRHDPATFREMWDEVGKRTGTEWRTTAEFRERTQALEGAKAKEAKTEKEKLAEKWHDHNTRIIVWQVVRVK